MRHIDGGWRWVEARERVFGRSRDGGVRRILGFASDVTDRHRLLESLAATSRALLTAEAQERRRIARELHDSVAQHLVAIDLTLSRLERRRRSDDMDQSDLVLDIRDALSAAHREVRTFSYLLHPPDLERLGLETTLRKFLEGFGQRSGLDVNLTVTGVTPVIEPVVELALFRVAQEALMNVHKHAGSNMVDIDLRFEPSSVMLEVRDDGVGLQSSEIVRLMSEDSGGVGIAAMKARMSQIGGAVELLPLRKGLLVRAMAPLQVNGDGVSMDA
jgi:signal transduction histidine kinase